MIEAVYSCIFTMMQDLVLRKKQRMVYLLSPSLSVAG